MSDVATVFVSGIRSLDADALLSAFNMEPSLLDANINAIATLFNRELHFINVNDEDYVRLVCDARLTGERWKARTRDMKGQFCRTKYQANVVWGWSHRIYDWTVVLPWSFGQMPAPLVYCQSACSRSLSHYQGPSAASHGTAQSLCSRPQSRALEKWWGAFALSRVEFEF